MSGAEDLLNEIAGMVSEELDKRKETVQKILAQLAVDEKGYKALMVREIVEDLWVAAQFAFSSPFPAYAPEEVKKKALNTFHKKLERDKRLFST